MVDALQSPRYSIQHAKRRIADFKSEVATFYATKPYAHIRELNADRTEYTLKVKLTKPLPGGLAGNAFDALNGLRSALDQLGYAIATCIDPTKGGYAHFPFGSNLQNVQSLKKRGSKDLPQEVFDLMVAYKPYKGGNDLLWALNKLENSQKHEVVIPFAMYTGDTSLKGLVSRPTQFARMEITLRLGVRQTTEIRTLRLAQGPTRDQERRRRSCLCHNSYPTRKAAYGRTRQNRRPSID